MALPNRTQINCTEIYLPIYGNAGRILKIQTQLFLLLQYIDLVQHGAPII